MVIVQGKLMQGVPLLPVTLTRLMLAPVSLVRIEAALTVCPVPGLLEFNAVLTGVVPVSVVATKAVIMVVMPLAVLFVESASPVAPTVVLTGTVPDEGAV